jgi:hypothetical protein
MARLLGFGSRQVNAAIRRTIWPALRECGFSKFTARNAWCAQGDAISVVNFQSFGSYLAGSLGCTTHSFAVNVGVWYPCVARAPWAAQWPDRYRSPTSPGPREVECHARNHLTKQISQPQFPRLGIWYVDRGGSNLQPVIADALQVLQGIGLPWLDQFRSLEHALQSHLAPSSGGRDHFVAKFGSVAGARVGCAIAVSLGKPEAAARLWRAVLDNEFYAQRHECLEEARIMLSILCRSNPDAQAFKS